MKKSKFLCMLLAIAGGAFVAACGDDDPEPTPPAQNEENNGGSNQGPAQPHAMVSFDKAVAKLTDGLTVSISLTDLQGNAHKAEQADTFAVEVDAASTAVQGKHFDFVDGNKSFVVAQGKSSASLKLKFLSLENDEPVVLVLRLASREGFGFGNNDRITISVIGTIGISGTWVYSTISNKDYYESMYAFDVSGFPEGTKEDSIVLVPADKENEYEFTPLIKGDLKKYFVGGECNISFVGEEETLFEELSGLKPYKAQVAYYTFPKLDYAFSGSVEQAKEGKVGFRMIKDENDNNILELTICDHQAPFLQDGLDWGFSSADLPVRVHFVRAQ